MPSRQTGRSKPGYVAANAEHGIARAGACRITGPLCRTPDERNKGKSHSFGGEYLELVPHGRIRYTDRFDDPNLPGEIHVALGHVSVGTDLQIVQEGLPDVISAEACCLGWQESLALLAKLVEAEIPD
jgi:uncharacterized protein YndB with AHSA1/START domain